MKKKYRVTYNWHSGECFGVTQKNVNIFVISDEDLSDWKKDFEKIQIDGSYNSIDNMEVIGNDK